MKKEMKKKYPKIKAVHLARKKRCDTHSCHHSFLPCSSWLVSPDCKYFPSSKQKNRNMVQKLVKFWWNKL